MQQLETRISPELQKSARVARAVANIDRIRRDGGNELAEGIARNELDKAIMAYEKALKKQG